MRASTVGYHGALLGVLLAASACAHDDKTATARSANDVQDTSATVTVTHGPPPYQSLDDTGSEGPTLGIASKQPPDTTAGAAVDAAPGQPTDDDIIGIMEAINKGEISAARIARGKAQSDAVMDYANLMLGEHTKALLQENALAVDVQLTPKMNTSTCLGLTNDAQKEAASLQQSGGRDFDRAYLDDMVQDHQKVLSLLDDTLIPNARNPQLKSQLQALKAHVSMHLDKAREGLKDLSHPGGHSATGSHQRQSK